MVHSLGLRCLPNLQELSVPSVGFPADIVHASGTDAYRVWMLILSPHWAADFFASIEKPTSHRLTSISVALSRLGELLRVQLHVPRLGTLELRLDSGVDADSLCLLAYGEAFLRAPRLRTVFLTLTEDSASSLEDALDVLRTSFRSMLIYYAELLDTITVSRQAERVCVGFSEVAKEYALGNE